MTDTAHTPTPWTAHKQFVNGPHRVTIATTFQKGSSHSEVHFRISDAEAQANAAFIVRACNCHGELLAVLRKITTAAVAAATHGEKLDRIFHMANDAIAEATKGE